MCVCVSVCQSQDDIGVSNGTPGCGTLGRASVPNVLGAADVMSEMTLRLRERRAKLDGDTTATTTTTTTLVCHRVQKNLGF